MPSSDAHSSPRLLNSCGSRARGSNTWRRRDGTGGHAGSMPGAGTAARPRALVPRPPPQLQDRPTSPLWSPPHALTPPDQHPLVTTARPHLVCRLGRQHALRMRAAHARADRVERLAPPQAQPHRAVARKVAGAGQHWGARQRGAAGWGEGGLDAAGQPRWRRRGRGARSGLVCRAREFKRRRSPGEGRGRTQVADAAEAEHRQGGSAHGGDDAGHLREACRAQGGRGRGQGGGVPLRACVRVFG